MFMAQNTWRSFADKHYHTYMEHTFDAEGIIWDDSLLTGRDEDGLPCMPRTRPTRVMQHLGTLPADMDFDTMRDSLVYHYGVSRGEANGIVNEYLEAQRDAQ